MRLRNDVDVSGIDWTNQASVIRRYAEQLTPGARRNAEIDRARWRAKLSHTARIYCFNPDGIIYGRCTCQQGRA